MRRPKRSIQNIRRLPAEINQIDDALDAEKVQLVGNSLAHNLYLLLLALGCTSRCPSAGCTRTSVALFFEFSQCNLNIRLHGGALDSCHAWHIGQPGCSITGHSQGTGCWGCPSGRACLSPGDDLQGPFSRKAWTALQMLAPLPFKTACSRSGFALPCCCANSGCIG